MSETEEKLKRLIDEVLFPLIGDLYVHCDLPEHVRNAQWQRLTKLKGELEHDPKQKACSLG